MNLSTIRHLPLFDATCWNMKRIPIHIIGCGAIGSKIAVEIAKLGAEHIHLWDDDKVEQHNIANQGFNQTHLEMLKVGAVEAMLADIQPNDGEIYSHGVKYTGQEPLRGIVFLCPDSAETRTQIFAKSCKLKHAVKLVVDVRMSLMDGRLYFIDPSNLDHCRFYEQVTNYKDSEAEVSPCGMPISIGSTSSFFASLAVNGFIRWAWMKELSIMAGTKQKGLVSMMDYPPAEMIVAMSPEFFVLETKK